MTKQEERTKDIKKIIDRVDAYWARGRAEDNLPPFCALDSSCFNTHENFRDICDDMLYLYRCIDRVEIQNRIPKDKAKLPSRDFGWGGGISDLYHLHRELEELLEANKQPPTDQTREEDNG